MKHYRSIHRFISIRMVMALALMTGNSVLFADKVSAPEFSKAGFFEVKDSGREVLNFDLGWRLLKGDQPGAHQTGFDDSSWSVVNCPNGIEYNSSEASGGVNYQGPAWYRKHFRVEANQADKILTLHFEAVMGKCKVWVNGQQVGEHFGGYLPFTVPLSGKLNLTGDNVVAVWADNSDDPAYPPGKPQTGLDFCYFGGIYRDVWLVATSPVYVTDPNAAHRIAGGGIFTHIQELSEKKAVLGAAVDIQNDSKTVVEVHAQLTLLDPTGTPVAVAAQTLVVRAGASGQIKQALAVKNPRLWAPWSPSLYRLEVVLSDARGSKLDGVATRVGLRKVEFKGKDGLYLNNQPYPGKLMGANRHQDHGYVGYAIANNGQWRDAKILKDAACDIVRAGHYPADPAFMDACDELGLFFIVATPGWQFWNEKDAIFEQRVYADIRNMVRRDRNHPSVIMWEPVLNETMNPDSFTINAHKTVHEEYPYQGAFTACDRGVGGNEIYDVIFAHTEDDLTGETRSVFQREYGSVSLVNSPNRLSRAWGERAQLIQARQYAESTLGKASWELIYRMPRQFVGGALWHPFDHFAGKHPRPFFGGIVDVFRQPKYSYYLFASQRDVSATVEPMVYLAHEVTPISEPDVTVYTNCEEVRLTVGGGLAVYQKTTRLPYKTKGDTKRTWATKDEPRTFTIAYKQSMPHPIVTFKDAFVYEDTMDVPLLSSGKPSRPGLLVEGLIGGKVVASTRGNVPGNGERIELHLEDRGLPLAADGSDFVLIVANAVDKNGTVVRLIDNTIKFEVSGEGAIIGDESISANPKRMEWGTAPLLVRSTNKAGKIKIKASLLAEGPNTIKPVELVIESVPVADGFNFTEIGSEKSTKISSNTR